MGMTIRGSSRLITSVMRDASRVLCPLTGTRHVDLAQLFHLALVGNLPQITQMTHGEPVEIEKVGHVAFGLFAVGRFVVRGQAGDQHTAHFVVPGAREDLWLARDSRDGVVAGSVVADSYDVRFGAGEAEASHFFVVGIANNCCASFVRRKQESPYQVISTTCSFQSESKTEAGVNKCSVLLPLLYPRIRLETKPESTIWCRRSDPVALTGGRCYDTPIVLSRLSGIVINEEPL